MRLQDNKIIRFFIKKEHLPLDVKTPEVIKKVNNFFRLPGFLKNEVVFLFIVLTLFILIASYKLDEIPGFREEEGIFGLLAKRSVYDGYFDISELVFSPTTGPYTVYLPIVFFLISGVGVFQLRFLSVILATISLVVSYLFAKRLFNVDIAKISLVLQAFLPVFIIISGISWIPNYYSFTIPMILYFGFRWFENKKVKFLYLSSFFIGFAINIKIIILYFLFALLFSITVLKLGFVRVKKKEIVLFFIILLFSASPYVSHHFSLIIDEIRSPTRDPLHNILNHMLSSSTTSYYGVNNLDFVNNLNSRLSSMSSFLSGRTDLRICPYPLGNELFPIIFYFFFFLMLLIAIIKCRTSKESFIIIMFSVLLVELCFTTSGFVSEQFLVTFPLPMIILAYGLSKVVNLFKPIMVVLLILVALNFTVIYSYYSCLELTGGSLYFSMEIHNVLEYLENSNAEKFVILFWGLWDNLPFMSDDPRLSIDNLTRFSFADMDDYGRDMLKKTFENNTLFILRGSGPEFLNLVESAGKSVVVEKIFYTGLGDELCTIYRM